MTGQSSSRNLEYFIKFCLDRHMGTGGDFISAIIDGIRKDCRRQLTDTYKNIDKLLQLRGGFRPEYLGDRVREFINLSRQDFLLHRIQLDHGLEFYVRH